MDWPSPDVARVRKRPGLYVGDTRDGTGLHNLVYEVVGNALNEAAAGFAKTIAVTLNVDGSCTISDDGRGIPFDRHPHVDASAAEVILCSLAQGRSVALGPHQGVGLCAVNALSSWLELRVRRHGHEFYLRCADGIPEAPPRVLGSADGTRGTELTFKPSPSFFTPVAFEAARLQQRLQELSLQHRVSITFNDHRH